MVRQNDIDLLFFLDKRIDFPEWVKVSERKEEIFFVASAASPLADCKKIPLDELVEQPFLLTEHGISYRYAFEQMVAQNGLEIHPFLETGNTQHGGIFSAGVCGPGLPAQRTAGGTGCGLPGGADVDAVGLPPRQGDEQSDGALYRAAQRPPGDAVGRTRIKRV